MCVLGYSSICLGRLASHVIGSGRFVGGRRGSYVSIGPTLPGACFTRSAASRLETPEGLSYRPGKPMRR